MNNPYVPFPAPVQGSHHSPGHFSGGLGACLRLLPALLLGMSVLSTCPAAASSDITQMSLEQLLDVTIIGASKYAQKQDKVAAAVSVITRDEIKAFGWRTIDEALASLPGVHTTYDRQYHYIGTRGFGLPGDFNTRLLLTVNGNRINDVVYDAAISGRAFPVDIDLIERIEFIPGPGGAVYGQNALFGVVNVVTRSGEGVNGTELAVAYQDRHTVREGRASWGRVLGNGLDVVLSVSAMKARGEDHFYDFGDAGIVGTASGMDGVRDKEFFAQLARGPWSFDFSYGDYRKDDPTAQYFSDPLVPGQYQRDRYLLTQLQYQDSLADDTLQLTARVFLGRERYSGLFSYGDPYLAEGASDWQGIEMRLLSTAWNDHKVLVGLEAQDNSRRDQRNVNELDPTDLVEIPGSGWRVGVYAQDEWTLSDTLTTTLGLRLDRNDITGNELSPRAALIWNASDATTVKAMYGRAHRAPNAFERDYDDIGSSNTQVANPDLDGETVDTLELVMDHRLSQDLRLRAAAYQWSMQGLVTLGTTTVIDPNTLNPVDVSQYQSGEDVEARGIELSADKRWAWGGRLRGSLSYQDVAYASGVGLDNSPQLLGKLNFSGPLASTGVRFGYELQYVGERQSIDGTDLASYWLSNLHLSTDALAKGLEVSLGLYNLFDTRYENPGSDINWQNAIEQDGRSARLKATYSF